MAFDINKCNARNSQRKAYLSAIIVSLFIHNFKQAEKCYNDCSQTDAFMGRVLLVNLFLLLEKGIKRIKRVAESSTISNLEHIINRLTRKLPTGELDVAQVEVAAEEEGGDELDEDNLT